MEVTGKGSSTVTESSKRKFMLCMQPQTTACHQQSRLLLIEQYLARPDRLNMVLPVSLNAVSSLRSKFHRLMLPWWQHDKGTKFAGCNHADSVWSLRNGWYEYVWVHSVSMKAYKQWTRQATST